MRTGRPRATGDAWRGLLRFFGGGSYFVGLAYLGVRANVFGALAACRVLWFFYRVEVLFCRVKDFHQVYVGVVRFFMNFEQVAGFRSRRLPAVEYRGELLSSGFGRLVVGAVVLLLDAFSHGDERVECAVGVLEGVHLRRFACDERGVPGYEGVVNGCSL